MVVLMIMVIVILGRRSGSGEDGARSSVTRSRGLASTLAVPETCMSYRQQ